MSSRSQSIILVIKDNWGGVEQALSANWSIKAEYDYLDFGTQRYSFFSPSAGGTSVIDVKSTVEELKVGANYHF